MSHFKETVAPNSIGDAAAHRRGTFTSTDATRSAVFRWRSPGAMQCATCHRRRRRASSPTARKRNPPGRTSARRARLLWGPPGPGGEGPRALSRASPGSIVYLAFQRSCTRMHAPRRPGGAEEEEGAGLEHLHSTSFAISLTFSRGDVQESVRTAVRAQRCVPCRTSGNKGLRLPHPCCYPDPNTYDA